MRDKSLQLIRDIPEEIKEMIVFGDQDRIQQVLAEFLRSIVEHAPAPKGWVEIQVNPTMKHRPDGVEVVRLEFRYSYHYYLPKI